MTGQENKAKFKQAIDHTLSGLQGNPDLAQRVLESAGKGEKTMKYHIPKGLVIALIALLCMGTVAVAAGVYGGTINWEGEIIYDEPHSDPTPSPTPWPVDDEERLVDEAYEKALWAAEDYAYEEAKRTGSMYILYDEKQDSSRWCDLSVEITSEEEFERMMAEAPWLPKPNDIPEGYAFERADVYYTCAGDGTWEMVKSEAINDCIRVEWYKPTKPVATRYFLFYRQSAEDYHYLSFYVDLTLAYEPGNASFGFDEGMTAQVITVPGMENAIAISGEHACSLSMRHPLDEPLDVWYVGENGQYPQRLEDVWIDVSAPLMEISDLIPLFSAE